MSIFGKKRPELSDRLVSQSPESKPIAVQAVEALTPRLAGLGFKRRLAFGLYTIELSPGILGWLGLNRATEHYRGTAVNMNAVVGARNQAVERLVAELRGEKFHEYIPATVSIPLRHLVPESPSSDWLLFDFASVEAKADALASAVERFGLPAIRELTDPDRLRSRIEEGWGFTHLLVYRLPVLVYLQGDPKAALQILEASLAELGTRDDAAADELRAFGRAFESRVRLDL